ncbi:MAG: hypothetical protein KF773_12290 [Deltaproteobacteria bacterium]|nr:hypothetical protein [Deltaproteobacteria bacterium]
MDNEYADIYYVDTRNADPRDHRHSSSGSRPGWVPTPPSRTVYVPPSGHRPMPYVASPAMSYASAPVMYAMPQPQPTIAATLFGKLTTGQVVEMVAQLFAALQPLPSSPIATKDTSTDVGNLILYQGAIAQHAKRDEQIRTLGNLVGKVVG